MSDIKQFHQAGDAEENPEMDNAENVEQLHDEDGPTAADVIDKLNSENADLKDQLVRMAADMENLRKRTEREKNEAKVYAISTFARDMLSVADNLARALSAIPAEALEEDARLKSLADGVEMTERAMISTLQNHGVRKIEALGQKFDPNMHQAMFELQDPSVPQNTIQQELQAGYIIGDRVLRASQVGVAKGGEKAAPEAVRSEQTPDDGE